MATMLARISALQRSPVLSAVAVRCHSKKHSGLPTELDKMNMRRFDDRALKTAVGGSAYKAFHDSIMDGSHMPAEAGEELAKALGKWAMSHGATKFSHWYQPVRGACGIAVAASKKETFIDFHYSDKSLLKFFEPGGFDAGRLFTSETDGSSYPNGGLRSTHGASGFTGWDRMSPPFVRGTTLYIPATFVTWNGEAIDEKTPHLRSIETLNKQSIRVLRALGNTRSQRVVANNGAEQEYFIIDARSYSKRPDLVNGGRTVIGAEPIKGQQTSQNYFGPYPARVARMMEEVEAELWSLGMSFVVQHNEVAPAQHEFSPVFSLSNVSADQNVMAMEVMNEISAKHGLKVLFHEKPFKNINGSGKHCNWGLNTDDGDNLFSPGRSPENQRRFIVFVACLARAIHLHGDLIRCGVAVPGNDHRLGGHEAPPAIISLYTGTGLGDHIKRIIDGGPLEGYHGNARTIQVGSPYVAPITGGAEDRNRTAPFPFCGNRFEFRAVGSSQNINWPLTVVNTAVADSLGAFADLVEKGMSVQDTVVHFFRKHGDAIFNGNGYSQEWVDEAKRRGLPNLRSAVDALHTLDSEKNHKLFLDTNVFKPRELAARKTIMLQEYSETILIEANTMSSMLTTGVIPAAQRDLARYSSLSSGERKDVYSKLIASNDALRKAVNELPKADVPQTADYVRQKIVPAMKEAREYADAAETLIADDLYPFPKYDDLLFGHNHHA